MLPSEKLGLITRNLDEVINREELENILNVRSPRAYWGTSCTGTPHLGYFLPILKIVDLLEADCEVTILIADIHAFLDMKTKFEDLDSRASFYEALLRSTIQSLNAPCEKLKFVRGSDHQLSPEYILDIYKLSSVVRQRDCIRAGNTSVKESKNPIIAGIIYPLLQALDEEYLDVDLQIGGIDQRTIFSLAIDFLPKIEYDRTRIYLVNKMQLGINGKKMSASVDPDSKITLLETTEDIRKKIKRAKMVFGDAQNGIFELIKNIILPLLDRKGEKFIMKRAEENGGDMEYGSFEEMENDYTAQTLHPLDVKINVSRYIDIILTPIREKFDIS